MRKPLIAVLPLALLCNALAAKAIMKKRRALSHLIVLLALCFLASPVLAEEVLHCIDTENKGFHWEGGHAVCRKSISDSLLGNLRECLAHLV